MDENDLARYASPKPVIKKEPINLSQFKPEEIYMKLQEFGIPRLDAGLIAECILNIKSEMWQNNEEPKEGAVEKANHFFRENKVLIFTELTPSRAGKYIWEVKIKR
ncbi:Uncharacterised protein [Candidatus Gugararchaeum adminiculabundum]|nr:Uncharacterised protein [Candidatus Gugararchaeum adminiculabundum]